MSAIINQVRVQGRALPQIQQRLRGLVGTSPTAKRRPRILYAAAMVGVVVAIIVGQIVLSVSVSSGAYEIQNLQQQNKELSRTFADSSQKLDSASAPQHVAALAEGLGMVTSNSPAYLKLSDSSVLGQPHPATGNGKLLSGAHASLVQNILLTDIPAGAAPAAAKAAGNIPANGVAATAAAGADVALAGAPSASLPTPTTR
jgi:hypothetical protein